MRTLIRSEEFDAFYASLDAKVQQKVDYALYILSELKVVNTKLAKKLQSSDSMNCVSAPATNTG